MASRIPVRRRLATAARWPVGLGLTSWRYLWRTTPMYRDELAVIGSDERPPPLPDGTATDGVQVTGDGAGPLFHRCYRARVRDPRIRAAEVIAAMAADPDRVAPAEFATFRKVRGEPGSLKVGDEFVVRMPGPWDGPVRVVEVTARSFRLATLDGHLEAGQIRFSADDQQGWLVFSIESWTRSGDRFSHLLYDRARMAKEIQLHMWTSVIEQVAELAGGRITGGIDVHTRREVSAERLRALEDLRRLPSNFGPGRSGRMTPQHGWNNDEMRQPLPPGSFDVARRLLEDYRAADPSIVRATFRRDEPLQGRPMLLQLRFNGLHFDVGVRVTDVWDREAEVDGRRERVWGFAYETLEGHLETGRMDYELREDLDTGAVEFRLRAVSRSAQTGNPVVRLGFRLFGRREQLRFYRRTCERLCRLVLAELGPRSPQGPGQRQERILEGAAPEVAGIAERLVPRRTADPR